MQLTKRILLTVMEGGFLLLLSILTIAIAAFLHSFANVSAEYGLLLSSVLPLSGLLVIQARTRKWKREYDAARWLGRQPELSLHPNRAKFLRLIRRSLLWAPSAFVSFVLFFFPVATHLTHPFSHYLKHYRIPIPSTWTVLSPPFAPEEYRYARALISSGTTGRFGITPFWDKDASFSVATFGSVGPNCVHAALDERRKHAKEVSRKEFHLGGATMACWQYLPSKEMRFWHALPKPYWQIDCDTGTDKFERDLYADFSGREQDIPAFYRVLEHVTRTD